MKVEGHRKKSTRFDETLMTLITTNKENKKV